MLVEKGLGAYSLRLFLGPVWVILQENIDLNLRSDERPALKRVGALSGKPGAILRLADHITGVSRNKAFPYGHNSA